MTELFFLALFAALLIICVVTRQSVLYAMLAGYILFFSYSIIKKYGIW